MIFPISENFYTGILAVISYILTVLVIGIVIKRSLKITILNTFLDSVLYSLFFTFIVSNILDIFNIYSTFSVSVIFIIVLVIFVVIAIQNYGYIFFKEGYSFYGALEFQINLWKNKLIEKLTENKQISLFWLLLIAFQFLFVIAPAIIYPLPFQTDMKHHTLFVKMIIDQHTTTPSWTPIVPTLGEVFYQLGGHIFTAFGYSLISYSGVPIVTFVNFWFRFQFLATFYAFVFLTADFFPDIDNSKIFSAATLLITPVLFWVTRWGGFSWLFGLFVLIFLIKLTLMFNEFVSIDIKTYCGYALIFLLSLALLGFFHTNVLFYGLNFLVVYLFFTLITDYKI